MKTRILQASLFYANFQRGLPFKIHRQVQNAGFSAISLSELVNISTSQLLGCCKKSFILQQNHEQKLSQIKNDH